MSYAPVAVAVLLVAPANAALHSRFLLRVSNRHRADANALVANRYNLM